MSDPMRGDTGVKVRDVALSDLPQVAALHKRQFGDHFLGKYSLVILQGFYQSLLAGEVFLVAERHGEIVGYVSGGDGRTLQRCRRRFLLRNLPQIAMEITIILSGFIPAYSAADAFSPTACKL